MPYGVTAGRRSGAGFRRFRVVVRLRRFLVVEAVGAAASRTSPAPRVWPPAIGPDDAPAGAGGKADATSARASGRARPSSRRTDPRIHAAARTTDCLVIVN